MRAKFYKLVWYLLQDNYRYCWSVDQNDRTKIVINWLASHNDWFTKYANPNNYSIDFYV